VRPGRNRDPCFFGEQDYHAYLNWLGEALQREQCALHAHVLTNHVHLLATPERAALIPRLIIADGRRYVQYINHNYRRADTLWDRRYKSSLVEAETYLLLCQRATRDRVSYRCRLIEPGPFVPLWSTASFT